MRPLVWFRADLRTTDNAALAEASRAATRGCAAVFLLAPDQWREHDWAPVRVDLVLRTLAELSTSLGRLGIPLLIRSAPTFADAPQALLSLARSLACEALYYNREYEVNESRRDEAVTRAFESAGLKVHAFHDQTVIPPDDIRTDAGAFYTVYSPFKRKWMKHVEAAGGVRLLPAPKRQPDQVCAADPVPGLIAGFRSRIAPSLWPPGESEASRRLRAFVKHHIEAYRDERDFPARDATSVLSPYLAIGAISPRQCIAAAAEASGGRLDSGGRGPVHWISEVVWREFYRHILVGFPRVSMSRPFQPRTQHLRWRDDHDAFEAWRTARTGVPIVDAAMRQLHQTGWMHNRLRMITAMFLTKNLLIDWRLGERHFMNHLVDGDLANNNGGWQWSASTGTDAAPYFRIFNPVSQSEKFDPEGAFIRRYLPELSDLPGPLLHDPPPLERQRTGYPEMIVDLAASRQRAIEAFQALA